MKKLMAILALGPLLALGSVGGEPVTAISQTGCVPAPPGLIRWWPLDETSGTTAADIIGGNDGAHVGGPTPVAGKVTGALSFDGIDGKVFINCEFPFNQPGDATLEFWLKFPPNAHQAVFWGRAESADTNRFHFFVNPDSTVGFAYRSPSGVRHGQGECCTAIPIPPNTWTHIAITRTGNVYSIYVNGTLAASGTDATPDLPTSIGWQMSGRGAFMYLGSLDEVEIYNRALSRTEIQSIFSAGSAGKCKVITVEVAIDIKPGSCPNPLNVKSQGVLPVAIAGTASFNVADVDPASVRLAGVAPLRSNLSDVATPFVPFTGKAGCDFDCTDAGADGSTDLSLKFDRQEVVAGLGTVSDGDCLVITAHRRVVR